MVHDSGGTNLCKQESRSVVAKLEYRPLLFGARTHLSEAQCCRWVKRATGLAKIRVGGRMACTTCHAIDRVEDGAGSDGGVFRAEAADELVRW